MMRVTVNGDGAAELECAGRRYRCAIGPGGIKADKREGDGVTPSGAFPLRRVYFRPDRVSGLETGLPLVALKEGDGWCDESGDPNYNRAVKLPYSASCERLWREDEVYDLIVVLGYNDDPAVPGKGSAIFMHVARPGYPPTEGCVALAAEDLREVLKECGEGAVISIEA